MSDRLAEIRALARAPDPPLTDQERAVIEQASRLEHGIERALSVIHGAWDASPEYRAAFIAMLDIVALTQMRSVTLGCPQGTVGEVLERYALITQGRIEARKRRLKQTEM
jgi:hypothetical protein